MSIDVLQISPKTSNDTNESVKVNKEFNDWTEINLSKEQRDSFNRNIALSIADINFKLQDKSVAREKVLAQITSINEQYKKLLAEFNAQQGNLLIILKNKLLNGSPKIAQYLPSSQQEISTNTQNPKQSVDVSGNVTPKQQPPLNTGSLSDIGGYAKGKKGRNRVQEGEEKALGPNH